ncbi:hypothetical protein HanIR_Chr16g0827181 [Helianthus annuus]|nr:hypothetical protein HanIR_Chr16g0827181 [Helianthus annuus]
MGQNKTLIANSIHELRTPYSKSKNYTPGVQFANLLNQLLDRVAARLSAQSSCYELISCRVKTNYEISKHKVTRKKPKKLKPQRKTYRT